MKKCLLLLLVGLTLTTPNAFADGDDEEIPQNPPQNPPQTPPTPINIPIGPYNPKPEEIKPRGITPISGIYTNGVLELCFAVDMGTVIATVTNTTTGEMWCESGNSNDGVLSVEITPTPGNYSVTIETENGDIYLGMFAL